MKIATFNINNINRRLPNLLQWLETAQPDPLGVVTALTGFGDAIVFRIDPSLRHQVTEVTGRFAKTAYAGWFRTSPDYPTLFRGRHDRT